jgi:hypothetical protein
VLEDEKEALERTVARQSVQLEGQPFDGTNVNLADHEVQLVVRAVTAFSEANPATTGETAQDVLTKLGAKLEVNDPLGNGGWCTCGAKTPDPQYHAYDCPARNP